MELKLQQAIVATRAGRSEVAQQLLTQLIHEKPDDANAWFLLGHLVDTPERQTLYLRKSVELAPDNIIAKQRLMRLENPPVPAPVVLQQDSKITAVETQSDEIGTYLPPAKTAVESAPPNELPGWLQELDDKQLGANAEQDEVWQDMVAVPVRETDRASVQTAAVTATLNAPNPDAKDSSTSGDVWLVRILLIMVISAAIVLGILVLLILI